MIDQTVSTSSRPRHCEILEKYLYRHTELALEYNHIPYSLKYSRARFLWIFEIFNHEFLSAIQPNGAFLQSTKFLFTKLLN